MNHLALARTAVLVEEAVFLMGHVFRDFLGLVSLLDRGEMPLQAKQTGVVALGTLEFPLPFERAVGDPWGFRAVAALVLSITLADWNRAEAPIRDAQGSVSGAAQDAVATALMRLERGGALSD